MSEKVSNLENEGNALERAQRSQLPEIYRPVWLGGTDQVIERLVTAPVEHTKEK